MKALFVGAYSCLGIVAVLLGLSAMLALNLFGGVVGVLLLAIAGTCGWLVCGCRSDGPGQHA